MPESMVIILNRGKETPGTVRFESEKSATDSHSKNLYLLKSEVAALGNPAKIKVTIEPAAEPAA